MQHTYPVPVGSISIVYLDVMLTATIVELCADTTIELVANLWSSLLILSIIY